MGQLQIIMKNYLSKDLRSASSYSEKGKKSFLILNIISIVLFVIGSFAVFSSLYMFCNMIGSIVSGTPKAALHELIRVCPIIIAECGLVYVAAFIHNWTAPKSEGKFSKNVKKNGIICSVIGAIITLYVIVGVIAGLFHGLVEGYPTALFPLDLLFAGLAYIALGVCLLVFGKKIKLDLPYSDHKSNGFFGVLSTIQYMGTLYAFASFIYSFWVVDWSHGHIFYSLMLELILLIMVAMACVYKFIYCPLKKKEKNSFQILASASFLVLNMIVFALYLVAFSNDVAAPSDAWYGILAIDFTASFNAVTYVYGLMIILTPLIALIRGLVARAKIK